MIDIALQGSVFLLSLCMLLGFIKIVRGPTALSRLLALDALAVCSVALMAVLSFIWSEADFLELILLFSILGFLSTTTVVLYLSKVTAHAHVEDEA
jgi:multisubunit Na+/H+ antiporter MnhF subunit